MDVASGMDAIHKMQFTHSDLKPENILVNAKGRCKIADLGTARRNDKYAARKTVGRAGSVKVSVVGGTPPYMAPEVAQGKPYNTSADVFSFAILLWEILALKAPFAGFSRKEYYQKISLLGLRPPVHNSWPTMTSQIMKESWNAKPKERPDFRRVAAVIRADLNNLTSDPEVTHRTKHMKQRSVRSLHHRGATRGSLSVTEHGGIPDVPKVEGSGCLSDGDATDKEDSADYES